MATIDQDWFSKWVLYSPEKTAVKDVDTGDSLTYRELHNTGGNIANFLFRKYGLSKGDRIAVLSEYSVEYIALFAAAQKSGLILVPLNYRLSPNELGYIIKEAMPSLIFSDKKFSHLILEEIQAPRLSMQDIKSFWDREITTNFTSVEADEDDPVFILYTSGTTGFPKGVLYSHKMLFWNSINTSIALHINSETRTVNVMPPFHTGGWNVLLTPILHYGGLVCLCKKFDAEVVNELISSEQLTIFMAVPTMLQMMSSAGNFTKDKFSSLHYIIVGGEPMPIPLIEQYDKVGVAIRQGYGMTEVGPNITSLHHTDAIAKKGSIGRTNFYVRIKIVNDEGKEVEKNEMGELWINGPMVTKGYWNQEEMTAKSFSEDRKWFKTGDLVIRDENQYIYVVDRLKNMYISGGENIYPAEIERVINGIDDVEACVVIGVKDDKWGEVGKAVIGMRKGASKWNEEEIKKYCTAHLAKFKVPKFFEFVDQLPKTDSGKLDRAKIKKVYS